MTPLNEQAYQHLRELIITNKLDYQQIYSETKLSKELGISRTPFRDAIHRLAQEGYIDIIPSKGFMLHQINRKDIVETFQIRSALESYCTLQIAQVYTSRRAKKLFKLLDEIMEELENILNTTQSIEDFCEYDFEFHKAIINFLENEQYSAIYESFLYRMRQLATLSLSHKGRMKDTYDEHLSILDAMKSGNLEMVADATLKHMETPKGINLEDL